MASSKPKNKIKIKRKPKKKKRKEIKIKKRLFYIVHIPKGDISKIKVLRNEYYSEEYPTRLIYLRISKKERKNFLILKGEKIKDKYKINLTHSRKLKHLTTQTIYEYPEQLVTARQRKTFRNRLRRKKVRWKNRKI